MNLYRLRFRQAGYLDPKETVNVLAGSLPAALDIGTGEVKLLYKDHEIECVSAEEVARDVLISTKARGANG